ncbi:alpha-N-acetylgalactosaminide alpha-2,6-sialyltransferase 1-like isoform X2 [Apostichopus japonicus]|uniref:alpha-N-acetylgalactosaminide alpha-2,6-sialyltransferase 1-like isoform X2 n=1 Tax=Stichopus japonicus TaxID=307972 RepID=UPI003AB2299D
MRYKRLLINTLAVVLGACIAFSLYATLHTDFALTRGNIVSSQDYHAPVVSKKHVANLKIVKVLKDIKASEKIAQNVITKEKADALGLTALGDQPEFMFRRNSNFTKSTCSSSLQRKLSILEWTKDIYHPEIMQVMNRDVLNMSEYERLLPYWMPFGYKYHEEFKYEDLKEITNLFGSRDTLLGLPEGKDCVSCAVVGNGGVMFKSGKGKEINSHDLVFRVNNALRKGYETDVGTKTTHYVLMDRSLIRMPKNEVPRDKGIKYLFLPCRLKDYYYIRDVVTAANPKQKLTADPSDVRVFHPDFIRYIQKVWMITKSFRPSTGAVMFFAALHGGCDQISVYGMGFNAQYTEHYYDKEYKKYTNFKGSHDFQREINILKNLHSEGVINWYTRDIEEFQR